MDPSFFLPYNNPYIARRFPNYAEELDRALRQANGKLQLPPCTGHQHFRGPIAVIPYSRGTYLNSIGFFLSGGALFGVASACVHCLRGFNFRDLAFHSVKRVRHYSYMFLFVGTAFLFTMRTWNTLRGNKRYALGALAVPAAAWGYIAAWRGGPYRSFQSAMVCGGIFYAMDLLYYHSNTRAAQVFRQERLNRDREMLGNVAHWRPS